MTDTIASSKKPESVPMPRGGTPVKRRRVNGALKCSKCGQFRTGERYGHVCSAKGSRNPSFREAFRVIA